MAKTYWISFRLADHGQWAGSYDIRYNGLVEAVKVAAKGYKWWFDTSSFYLFASDRTIDQIASLVREPIDEAADLVIIGMIDYKGGRVIGNLNDQDIFDLAPSMKKV